MTATGSGLMDVYGIGPAGAARILADVGDVARFADRNRFASWTGTAPIDASSGEQIRHRLSRAGNRRLNHVLYIAAVCQIRHDTPGRGTTGASSPRARPHWRPCGAYAGDCPMWSTGRLSADAAPPHHDRGRDGPGRALGGDSDIQRGRPNPDSRLFGQATSRTRSHDATPTPDRQPAPTAP